MKKILIGIVLGAFLVAPAISFANPTRGVPVEEKKAEKKKDEKKKDEKKDEKKGEEKKQ